MHWRILPRQLKTRIWETYEIGQESRMDPSQAYLNAAEQVQLWIKAHFFKEKPPVSEPAKTENKRKMWSLQKAERVLDLVLDLGIELGLVTEEGEVTPPKPRRGRAPRAAPVPPLARADNATAAPPAAPAPATPPPDRAITQLCISHAPDADLTKFRVLPVAPQQCVVCAENGKRVPAPLVGITMDECKVAATALIAATSSPACYALLNSLGAQNITGAGGATALDPSRYKEFVEACLRGVDEAKKAVAAPKESVL